MYIVLYILLCMVSKSPQCLVSSYFLVVSSAMFLGSKFQFTKGKRLPCCFIGGFFNHIQLFLAILTLTLWQLLVQINYCLVLFGSSVKVFYSGLPVISSLIAFLSSMASALSSSMSYQGLMHPFSTSSMGRWLSNNELVVADLTFSMM